MGKRKFFYQLLKKKSLFGVYSKSRLSMLVQLLTTKLKKSCFLYLLKIICKNDVGHNSCEREHT